MQNFIKNLLNPPLKIEVGQIWHLENFSNDIVITDTKYLSKSIIRVCVIGDKTMGDTKDVTLKPTDVQKGIYGENKSIIRMTDYSIDAKSLKFYKSKIKAKAKNKLLKNLNNYEFSYDDIASRYINEIIEKLDRFRKYE